MNEVDDQDMEQSMDAFEAALSAKPIQLPGIAMKRILLARDGSNQDDAARALAEAAAGRMEAAVETLDPPATDKPFRRILEACAGSDCGLIVVPAPFAEDFAELGAASIGTNLDMLLTHRRTPLLVVRDPGIEAAEALREVVLPLSFLARDDAHAAAWALQLAARGGRVNLLAVADPDAESEAGQFAGRFLDAGDVDEAALSGLGHAEMAGLVAAVHRRAAESDLGCRVSVRVGPAVGAAAEFANALTCLIVVPGPTEPQEPAWRHVHALIRESRNPLLVV